MKHLLICSEYPPAAGGGIGTYTSHMARLLVEHGEVVHVIGQSCPEAPNRIEYCCDDRLIVHRLPFLRASSSFGPKMNPALQSQTAKKLFGAGLIPQSFSWQACALAEQLIATEKIDTIEGQEFEAPLHFLQYRRSCRCRPSLADSPPICIHFHSPSEFVVKWNELDLNLPYFAAMKRLEDFTIRFADGYLCPSNFLARQMVDHYGIAGDEITVIPYPLGDTRLIARPQSVWQNGSILFVGRLERRKGIIEWLKAAVAVAGQWPDVHFEFVGDNVLGTADQCAAEVVRRLIPKVFADRFHFRGALPRQEIARFMAKARIGVVPSRWENFPYAAIEQMSSGLPLIVSPRGGMGEMVVDGDSGWIAPEMSSAGLAAALIQALSTSPARLANMGEKAANRIRAVCDDQAIVNRHLTFKRALVAGRRRAGLKGSDHQGQRHFPAIAAGEFYEGRGCRVSYPYSAQCDFRKLVSLVTTAMISPRTTIVPIINQWRRCLRAQSAGFRRAVKP